jgi:hypothetical protein
MMNTRRTCPYCGREVVLGNLPIVAMNFGDELSEDMRPLPASGKEPLGWVGIRPVVADAPLTPRYGSVGRTRRALRASLPLPSVTELAEPEDDPARVCTHERCHMPLPVEIDSGRIFIIPVVGTVSSGKSSYLTILIQQAWREQRLAVLGFDDFSLDESSVQTYRLEYQRTLIRDRRQLDPTQPDHEVGTKPLICRVRYRDLEPALLFFHDISGEMLMNRNQRLRYAGFVRRADGIIFLVDPVCLDRPDGRSWAECGVQGAEELDHPQGPLFRSVVDGLDPEHRVPIAITLSKSDLVADAVPSVGQFLEEPSLSERMHPDEWNQDLSDIEHTVIRALQNLSELDLLNAQRQLDPALVSFHAVAALGSNPNDGHVDLRPKRCIDPLAAILFRIPRLTEPT